MCQLVGNEAIAVNNLMQAAAGWSHSSWERQNMLLKLCSSVDKVVRNSRKTEYLGMEVDRRFSFTQNYLTERLVLTRT